MASKWYLVPDDLSAANVSLYHAEALKPKLHFHFRKHKMDKHVVYAITPCDSAAGDSNLTDVSNENRHSSLYLRGFFPSHKSHGFNSDNIMSAL